MSGQYYGTWRHMLNRCTDPEAGDWKYYGGRGIRVCRRWRGMNGRRNFVADMGPKPTPKHELDRIDSDGDYTPDNCRWVTSTQQIRNRSNTNHVIFRGRKRVLMELIAEFSVKERTVRARINRGWSVERALTAKARPYRKGRAPVPSRTGAPLGRDTETKPLDGPN